MELESLSPGSSAQGSVTFSDTSLPGDSPQAAAAGNAFAITEALRGAQPSPARLNFDVPVPTTDDAPDAVNARIDGITTISDDLEGESAPFVISHLSTEVRIPRRLSASSFDVIESAHPPEDVTDDEEVSYLPSLMTDEGSHANAAVDVLETFDAVEPAADPEPLLLDSVTEDVIPYRHDVESAIDPPILVVSYEEAGGGTVGAGIDVTGSNGVVEAVDEDPLLLYDVIEAVDTPQGIFDGQDIMLMIPMGQVALESAVAPVVELRTDDCDVSYIVPIEAPIPQLASYDIVNMSAADAQPSAFDDQPLSTVNPPSPLIPAVLLDLPQSEPILIPILPAVDLSRDATDVYSSVPVPQHFSVPPQPSDSADGVSGGDASLLIPDSMIDDIRDPPSLDSSAAVAAVEPHDPVVAAVDVLPVHGVDVTSVPTHTSVPVPPAKDQQSSNSISSRDDIEKNSATPPIDPPRLATHLQDSVSRLWHSAMPVSATLDGCDAAGNVNFDGVAVDHFSANLSPCYAPLSGASRLHSRPHRYEPFYARSVPLAGHRGLAPRSLYKPSMSYHQPVSPKPSHAERSAELSTEDRQRQSALAESLAEHQAANVVLRHQLSVVERELLMYKTVESRIPLECGQRDRYSHPAIANSPLLTKLKIEALQSRLQAANLRAQAFGPTTDATVGVSTGSGSYAALGGFRVGALAAALESWS